ncbi:toluene-tolerance protein, putative [Marinomonas sp. MED121]|uniref:BolA family protein n=1 Tax=Marinomonas sp. MED121 TaxID=314277 RepID=UPI000068FD9C|nr:BolA/IbaG family iron-sulfur metabolism protein [Marinomonas sp. MED121]EAQ65366.1 toluene-tolerance protein, putative [Marinomonas sp. MED121]
MNANEVKALLEKEIESCEVIAEGEGCNFQLTLISPAFDGLTTVKRQQLVYSHLQDSIASGAIHAVTMKTYTPAQYSQIN